MIPYGRQDINQSDVDTVVEVLRSEFLTQGPMVPRFEKVVSEHVGARHGVAVNSATSALHIACLALELGPGDYLWTSPITFVASANCGLYCGAQVDFVDIDSKSYNICTRALSDKLKKAAKEGVLPKILVAVHLAGQSCDMQEIHRLSREYGFKIIEDASHAIGGKYKDQFIGACLYSDITIFSFHPVKIITTAEGGMAVTNDVQLANRMSLLRSHGITRDESLMTHESHGPWYYQQVGLGFNYRMTELQAALGVSQMARLDAFVEQRHVLARRYDEILKGMPLRTPWQHPDSYSALHLYIIRLDLTAINKTHRQVFESLRQEGIAVNLHYIPVYTQPFYTKFGYNFDEFPESQAYYAEAMSLPMFQGLTFEQQDTVVSALRKVLTT
ncbi:UDP-4-amino-4,6-dideoxy-N-acetyl-beta-L-altrosamine transaminase [Pseudomonas monteilii]|uniref:UDP-4-amino-4, 6-dideoxy-N-acetyl-beta-L-altrosamine transaminase n=1 Tax=Pseudomonas monteilii TaxID=76759 RepID=UPI0018AC8448|nr:UDP-4-amino-4,6-dideoxy-N-acetyl-beta-L-altrosamine transaminase [Pseudomonas monteilii]MBF8748649.1 UDP-4-amino-4,6-dideoxy-N-acetyl-beta-L-altrosamine transaminase [Pseudomonas monteilii]